MPTSASAAAERNARRTWWFVYGVWALLTLQLLVFVARYAQPGPVVDEWEFIPAMSDEEPFWPWLWKLHNEHRFPLPRLIWYPLTRVSADFSTCCYVSLAGASLLTLLLIRLAGQLRDRLHFADAFFPMSILHTGHWENLRMGYQIVFMMNLVFAGILLWIILRTNRNNLFARALQAGTVTLLLLACGAGGLAFGPFIAIWMLAIIYWLWTAKPRSVERRKILWVVGLLTLIPVYVWLYLMGYERPSYHPDPVVVWGSRSDAIMQSSRSAVQALDMAFGPAGMGLWPLSIFLFILGLLECILLLVRTLARRIDERPRAFGLLLYLASVLFMAVGIGWGRSGFTLDNGEPGFMAHAARYGWITWPALGAIYYMWMLYGGPRTSRWVPLVLFATMAIMLPINIATGFIEGEKHRQQQKEWEKSVREQMSDHELIRKYYPAHYFNPRLRERMLTGLHLLRKNRIQYYRPLPERPDPLQNRSPQRKKGRRIRRR
jgi:hypothetical protein